MCGVCQNTLTQPYRYGSSLARANVDLKNHPSIECRHIFCGVCLISWWQASNKASCPTCRRISTQTPVRDHTHETLIDTVIANSGERVDPEPFNPQVFEEFLRKRGVGMVERGFLFMHEQPFPMDERSFAGNEYLFAGNEQPFLMNEVPFDTIDLTGDDDSETDFD